MEFSNESQIREAIMCLTLCAQRCCTICKYNSVPEGCQPSDECQERIKKIAKFLHEHCPSIVRCKDCRWGNCYDEIEGRYECTIRLGSSQVEGDDFCSYGEREDEE